MAAILLIDQTGLPAGSAGFARTDGLNTGAKVTVQSVGSASTHEARLLTYPENDDTVAASWVQVGPTTWEFNPKALIDGAYRIELVTDRGLASEDRTVKVFGIRDTNGYLFPSFGLLADPLANRPDLADPAKLVAYLKACELNEPTAIFTDGYPFGWHAEVDRILRALVSSSGGGPMSLPWVGEELVAWNKTDLTQFGTGATLVCRTDVGGAPGGTITPTVDAGGRLGQSRIVLTSGGGFVGGWAMPFNHGLNPLPDRYWIYNRFDVGASGSVGGFVTPFGMESPLAAGYFEAPCCHDSYSGATNNSTTLVSVYWPAWTSSLMTSSGMSPDMNWNTIPKPYANTLANVGGVENLILVERQVNQDPTAGWWYRRWARWSDGNSSGEFFRMTQQVLRANLTGNADPAPEWNGQDMDQIYLGAYSSPAATGPFVAYSDLRIFAWDPTVIGVP